MNEAAVKRQVVGGVWQRYVGWITIFLLAAFLTNNFLNIYFGFQGLSELFKSFSGTALISLLIYIVSIVVAIWQVNRTLNEGYRQQANSLHNFNVYFLRGCFFAVLFIGCVDFMLALLRSIDILKYFVSDSTARALGLGNVVGPYIHVPLIILGFIVARFSRTLGWTWLALLIVFAELIIVISR